MMKKLITAVLLLTANSVAATADDTDAAARGALFTQRVVCVPQKLIAVDGSAKKGFSLDLDKAITQLGAGVSQRTYDIPDSNVRVGFTMKYSEKQIEISKMFSQILVKGKVKTEKLMMSFYSPWTIDLPMPAGTIFVLKSDASASKVPAFDVECQLERKRIDNDCPDCS